MKILIISDSHRHNENIETVLNAVKPIDFLIHCGDAEGSEYFIGEMAGCPMEIVTGNNDFFSSLPREREFELQKYKIWLTHGHYYNVSIGPERIMEERLYEVGHRVGELAARVELSKGFISQLERDLTSPSIATLTDILEALGMSLADFFSQEDTNEKVVFGADDVFVKEDEDAGHSIHWLIPNAQKNSLEPILVTLQSGGKTWEQDPHEGEEFGYVLLGGITLHIGGETFKVRKGSSFCFKPTAVHYISNDTKREAKVLWVSTPPSF